jgi:hypothetical protein
MVQVLPDDAKVFAERTTTDAAGNVVTIKPQGVADGENIGLKESQSENTNVIGHEMGHTMGMGHSSGLMKTEAGGKKISKTSIGETLGHSGVGQGAGGKTTNATLQNKSVVGTTPENFQNGRIKKIEDEN